MWSKTGHDEVMTLPLLDELDVLPQTRLCLLADVVELEAPFGAVVARGRVKGELVDPVGDERSNTDRRRRLSRRVREVLIVAERGYARLTASQ